MYNKLKYPLEKYNNLGNLEETKENLDELRGLFSSTNLELEDTEDIQP